MPMSTMLPPGGMSGGPTMGSLEQMIIMDNTIQAWEKQQALSQLKAEMGYAPSSTLLTPDMLRKIGGGVLGTLIARYFGMGMVGMAIAGAAGYGLGKVVSDFYKPANKVRWMI